MSKVMCGLVFLSLFIMGCATRPQVESWQLSQGRPHKSLLVMDILLKADGLMSSGHECKLKLRYEDGSDLALTIRPGQRRYFWSAPKGSYEMKHMTCGLFTEYDMSRFPSFRVKNERTYYFGKLELELENKESLRWSQPALDKDQLLVQYLSLPNSLKPEIYSPYSSKKITESLIRSTPLEPRVQVEKAPELAAKLQEQWPLRECQKQERKRNPVWAGEYVLQVLAQEGLKVVESNDPSDHLYTAEFQTCSNKALTKWLGDQTASDFKMEVRL